MWTMQRACKAAIHAIHLDRTCTLGSSRKLIAVVQSSWQNSVWHFCIAGCIPGDMKLYEIIDLCQRIILLKYLRR